MAENVDLSAREREILRLVANGTSNKEIARALSISPNTVKVHLRNIFAKTGVASRTEATLHAIRIGLIQVEGSSVLIPDAAPQALVNDGPEESGSPSATPASNEAWPLAESKAATQSPTRLRVAWSRHWWLAGLAIAILILFASTLLPPRPPSTALASPLPPTIASRWQMRASMPTARSAMAAAMYEGGIYAIGGLTSQGVTGVAERYDTLRDTWTNLTPLPIPVTDASAAVVGGHIYVPGGRTNTGEIIDTLQVFDPRQDRWAASAKLPIPLSAYALAQLEGRLYLFGGWDGERYSASAFEYNVNQDAWRELSPMTVARAHAAAATIGGRIYVMGGYNGSVPLSINEAYAPEFDNVSGTPWTTRAPLPLGRYGMGATGLAGMIYLVGGSAEKGGATSPAAYLGERNEWQSIEPPALDISTNAVAVSTDTNIYVLGGESKGMPISTNMSYQAIYTILIPVMR
jgi:DNA-binding CsgD family transcriptional regulator/N-acetylneuraminic acid mutarotase